MHTLLDLETYPSTIESGAPGVTRTLLKCPNQHDHDDGIYQLKYLIGDRDGAPVTLVIYQCSLCMKRWLGVSW